MTVIDTVSLLCFILDEQDQLVIHQPTCTSDDRPAPKCVQQIQHSFVVTKETMYVLSSFLIFAICWKFPSTLLPST